MLLFCSRLMFYLLRTHKWSTTDKLIDCTSVQHIFLKAGAKMINASCALFSLFQSLMCWTKDRWHKRWRAHLQCVYAACLCHDCNVHMALQSCHMLLCINHRLLKKNNKKLLSDTAQCKQPGQAEANREAVVMWLCEGGGTTCLLIHTEAGKVWITRPGIQEDN